MLFRSEITYHQSLLELDVLTGTYLARRDLAKSRNEVTERTRSIMQRTTASTGTAR